MDLPGCQNTFEKIPTQPHTLHTLPLPRSLGLAACCCSSRPIIGMDEHWTTLTRRRPLVMHGWPSGARVSRHPAAGSQHSYGVDSTTRRFCANCIMKVFFTTIAKQVISVRSGDRDDRDVRDWKKSGKCPARWSAVYSASH